MGHLLKHLEKKQVIGATVLIGFFILLFTLGPRIDLSRDSVEMNLAEYSPRGASGGLAIPASGSTLNGNSMVTVGCNMVPEAVFNFSSLSHTPVVFTIRNNGGSVAYSNSFDLGSVTSYTFNGTAGASYTFTIKAGPTSGIHRHYSGSFTMPSSCSIPVSCTPTPSSQVAGQPVVWSAFITSATGSGLLGEYYNDPDQLHVFTGLNRVRVDPTVNFSWSPVPTSGPSGTTVGGNYFTVRWTGSIKTIEGGAYRFQTQTDDGVRLYVNDQLVINDWQDQSLSTNQSSLITLAGNTFYNIQMEMYQSDPTSPPNATAILSWDRPGATAMGVIPTTSLYPYAASGYAWSGTDSLTGTASSTSKTYATVGTKTGSVTLTPLSTALSPSTVSCTSATVTGSANIQVSTSSSGPWSDGPISVNAGNNVAYVNWSSVGASSCSGGTNFSTGGGSPTSGTTAVNVIPGTNTYTVTCTSGGSPVTDSVVINGAATTLSLTASSTRVKKDSTTRLNWNTGGRVLCSITSSSGSTLVASPAALSGTVTTPTISNEVTYTLSCTDPGSVAEVETTVRILPSVTEF